jgi:hypothetical protein
MATSELSEVSRVLGGKTTSGSVGGSASELKFIIALFSVKLEWSLWQLLIEVQKRAGLR